MLNYQHYVQSVSIHTAHPVENLSISDLHTRECAVVELASSVRGHSAGVLLVVVGDQPVECDVQRMNVVDVNWLGVKCSYYCLHQRVLRHTQPRCGLHRYDEYLVQQYIPTNINIEFITNFGPNFNALLLTIICERDTLLLEFM